MSGIEIIGVVLGALPLVISAYQHRKGIKGATTTLNQFETRYDNFVGDLEHVELLLKLNLQRLLQPSLDIGFASKDEVDEFIRDPHPEHGTNAAILEAIAESLGECTERYLKLMGDMHDAIMTLLEELDFYEVGIGAHLSSEQHTKASRAYLKSAFKYRNTQLRFSLKNRNREGVLAIIRLKQQQMNELAEFSNTSIRVGTGPVKVSTDRATRFLLSYAQHVSRIYSLLQQRWGCLCMEKHFACVWLKHPAPKTSNFDIYVVPTRGGSAQHTWKPQGLNIRWGVASYPKPTAAVFNAPAMASGQSTSRANLTIPLRTSNSNRAQQTSTIVLEPTAPRISQARDSVHEIDVLCDAIAASPMSSQLGLLTHPNEPFETYLVQLGQISNSPSKSTSLLEVLQRSHPQKLWRNRSARFQLALTIASSHLQLLPAPWTPIHWSMKDIMFPHEDDGLDGSVVLDMPFVESDFKEMSPQISRRSERAFTSLGIILMELLFGELIEDHPLWQQEGWATRTADSFCRLIVAKQWLNDVLAEGGPLYFAAVQWCLTESPTQLKGERWRKDLANRVILPLERSCDWIKVDAI